MSEYNPEDHTVDATDATQNAVVSLLDVMNTHVAEELPEEKRLDMIETAPASVLDGVQWQWHISVDLGVEMSAKKAYDVSIQIEEASDE